MDADFSLCKLLVTNLKVVLIIDDRKNRERIAVKFIDSQLRENGEDPETIKIMPTGSELKDPATFDTLLNECSNNNNNDNNNISQIESSSETDTSSGENTNTTKTPGYNIILPTLSDLLCYQSPAFIFEFLNKVRRSEHVLRVFIWATPHNLLHPHAEFILSGCEYMADSVIRLETEKEIFVILRPPNAPARNRRFTWQVVKTQIMLSPMDDNNSNSPAKTKVESKSSESAGGTFKIELDEDEMMARNALTLPYERSNDPSAVGNDGYKDDPSSIIYTPDVNDDFDEEDPDEDLNL